MSSYFERQKCLFNQLKDAEEQYSFSKSNKASIDIDYGTIDRKTYRKLKHEMKQFRGKESIFKRSEASLRECLRAKTIPDYIKNPQKWAYYSLADVTPEQMSDATNAATAHALIRELEKREEAQQNPNQEPNESALFKKPIFQVSKTVRVQYKQDEEKAIFKSNKIIMPEYVVGVSHKKENKRKIMIKETKEDPDRIKKAELKLNHLFEMDDDCND
ncbi:unnamed protein product [Parnassius apollo]|uniref:U5 small nuclear ribonucleoprotein TSSC4 n=1 Tax=Parnassius apollo TaxID=110799 RepID=A0A8S3W8N3_PARAO|nr:unnamed protein product [Parnassius apollo]